MVVLMSALETDYVMSRSSLGGIGFLCLCRMVSFLPTTDYTCNVILYVCTLL